MAIATAEKCPISDIVSSKWACEDRWRLRRFCRNLRANLTLHGGKQRRHVAAEQRDAGGPVLGDEALPVEASVAAQATSWNMPIRSTPLDGVIEENDVRILVDPNAVLFLLGTEMDYKVDKLSAQFTFNNPNQTAACGCGETVQIEPAPSQAEAH